MSYNSGTKELSLVWLKVLKVSASVCHIKRLSRSLQGVSGGFKEFTSSRVGKRFQRGVNAASGLKVILITCL